MIVNVTLLKGLLYEGRGRSTAKTRDPDTDRPTDIHRRTHPVVLCVSVPLPPLPLQLPFPILLPFLSLTLFIQIPSIVSLACLPENPFYPFRTSTPQTLIPL